MYKGQKPLNRKFYKKNQCPLSIFFLYLDLSFGILKVVVVTSLFTLSVSSLLSFFFQVVVPYKDVN